MRKLILLSSKIETEIENHFENEYEISEPQTDFECKFEFSGFKIMVPYTFNGEIDYRNEGISAEYNGKSYSIEDSEYFAIKRKDYNPFAKTLQSRINVIIEYKERKQIEINESQAAIKLDQDIMRAKL